MGAMNELNVSLQHSISTLAANGWSRRRIARELDIHRETAARYLRLAASKPAKVPTGILPLSRSQCEPWREFIEKGCEAGLSAQHRSTIMTSIRPLEQWGKLLSDLPTPGAILDRFVHHAQVIAITGKSYRVKEAPVVTQENKKQRKSNGPSTAGGAT